ncbi:MAG TPA: EamA family transporter [Candidatus Doudnabacteria bacterium]|nr:EamA family transporter [Candidatus Doudnabacteria bacterium]
MWIALALLAPLLWAASNIFDKYALSKLSRGVYEFIFLGSLASFVIILVCLAIFGLDTIATVALWALVAGASLQFSYLFYSYALNHEDASYVIPLYITYSVVVLLLGPLFGESITTHQYISFAIVFIGALILSQTKLSFGIHRYRRGALLMIPAIILLSFYTLFFHNSLNFLSFADAFIYTEIGFAVSGVSLLLIPRCRREILAGVKTANIKKLKYFLLNDTIDLSGHLLYQYALLITPSASLIAVIGGVQPFYVLILGLFFTFLFPQIVSEKVTRQEITQKLIGTAIILSGIIYLNLF